MKPIITLLTDFGTADHYVAAMKGVILGICPDARLIDISHEVTPYGIAEGAYLLAQAWDCFPKGTIHLAVVDPGVGSDRRAIAVESRRHRFVAPDNGLLSMALEGDPKAKVREINVSRYFRKPVSATFHGRDVFAPVAAHLARGRALARVGPAANMMAGEFVHPRKAGKDRWIGSVLRIDRFGNIVTNFRWDDFAEVATEPFRLRIRNRAVSNTYLTYTEAPLGRLFVLRGSGGFIEVSINQSDAAKKIGGVQIGDAIIVEFQGSEY